MLRHLLCNKLLSCSRQLTYSMLLSTLTRKAISGYQIPKRKCSNVISRSSYERQLSSARSLSSFSTTIQAEMLHSEEQERRMARPDSTQKPAALTNYSATDMEQWLVDQGILVPDAARNWSFDGRCFASVVTSDQLQSYVIPQDKLGKTYHLLQPYIECKEKNLLALVSDIVDTIPFKHLNELPPCNHKKLLGDFYKKELNFNPYNPDKWDIRFLEKTGSDPVYELFQSFTAKASDDLYILKALSGGGKTGVMLNAVGRRKHLIFVECTFPGVEDTKDYHDGAFLEFATLLTTSVQSITQPNERTKHALLECRAFWLCRLMLLKAMQLKWAISPEEWIYWTNEAGQEYLKQLQLQFRTILINDLARGKTFEELESTLRELIERYISDTGAWFAVDEAQTAFNAKPKYKKFWEEKPNEDENCSLLHVMTIYALPATSKRIIAGTSLTKFVHLLKSGAGKGRKLFDLADSSVEFPYVKPDDAWTCLEQYFDFGEIDQTNIDAAKHVLQGRLRYVFGFIRALAKTIALHGSGKEDRPNKNAIFLQALDNFKADLKKNFFRRWKELRSKQVSTKHLVHVLLAQHYAPTLSWSAKRIEETFDGVSVEETGFLFVEKSEPGPDGEVVYSIKEPFVVSSLLQIPEVADKIASYIAEINLSAKEIGSAEPQEIGKMAENYILWCFVNDFEAFIKTLPRTAPNWVKSATCEWISGGSYSKYQDLLDQVESLLLAKPLIEEWLASPTPKPDLAEALASDDAFAPLVRDDMTLDRSTVEQLAKVCSASTDKQPELLYLLLRPKDYLLRPSNLLGPDIIGFLRYKNEDVLVTVSMSLRKEEDPKKFEKNKAKTDPAEFYHYLKTEGKIKVPAIYDAFDHLPTLPKKVLRLSITIPFHQSFSYVSRPGIPGRIHFMVNINQDTLHTLGFNLAKTLEELASIKTD